MLWDIYIYILCFKNSTYVHRLTYVYVKCIKAFIHWNISQDLRHWNFGTHAKFKFHWISSHRWAELGDNALVTEYRTLVHRTDEITKLMYILVHKIKPENILDLYGRVSLRASLGIICKMTREMICINTSTLPDQMRDLTTAWQYPATATAGWDTGRRP